MASAIHASDTPLFDLPVQPVKTEAPPLTVSGLTRAIRDVLQNAFAEVTVEGEVSNFIDHRSGHRYWTLKDEGSQIACVFWKTRNASFDIKDGQKILCRGRIAVYPPQGKYQLDVYQVRPLGVGALQLAYEKLYQKLSTEGLFEISRKRPIPRFPQTLGVVTSADGAAFDDILTAVRRRYPLCKILLRPSAVQGIGAELQIAQGIRDFNRLPEKSRPDVLIVGRGGGSLEDLWCFNEEAVARAIFSSSIPIISAVGHEVDVTIADFVADCRAATPTAAAELATPDKADILATLAMAQRSTTARVLRHLEDIQYDMEHRIGVEAIAHTITSQMESFRQIITRSRQTIVSKLQHAFELHKLKLAKHSSSLQALNPKNILDRGYAIVQGSTGTIISSAADFPSEAKILFKDGQVSVVKGS